MTGGLRYQDRKKISLRFVCRDMKKRFYSLSDKVFGLRHRSPSFDDVRFVRLTQGVPSNLAKTLSESLY